MKKIFLALFFVLISVFSFSSEIDQDNTKVEISQVKDFDKIKGKTKKEIFISVLVPIINEFKNEIEKERALVEELSKKAELNDEDNEFLEKKYTSYKVSSKSIKELLSKMVVPPTSLILAQASLESGWGTSKLAKEGNNLFGIRSTLKDPTRAVQTGKNSFYKKYSRISDSVADYIMTLCRHKSYEKLRVGISKGEDSLSLTNHLANYSEAKQVYAKRLTNMIKGNSFQQYD